MVTAGMNHLTSKTGHDGIRSQIECTFLAIQPPCGHPRGDGLVPLEGGRGKFIFYSPDDYSVPRVRQTRHGPREEPA